MKLAALLKRYVRNLLICSLIWLLLRTEQEQEVMSVSHFTLFKLLVFVCSL